jgi:hypothetical protein
MDKPFPKFSSKSSWRQEFESVLFIRDERRGGVGSQGL